MSASSTNEILATYDQHARDARKVVVGGVLTKADIIGIWRRVANIHDTTPEAVREIVEKRHA